MGKPEKEQIKDSSYKVAVASSDGILVNRHFGGADTFYIYQVTEAGQHTLLEKRTVTPICMGGEHDDDALRRNIGRLKDCTHIMAARIGISAAYEMTQSGIIPMELPGMVEESMGRLSRYEQLRNLF